MRRVIRLFVANFNLLTRKSLFFLHGMMKMTTVTLRGHVIYVNANENSNVELLVMMEEAEAARQRVSSCRTGVVLR